MSKMPLCKGVFLFLLVISSHKLLNTVGNHSPEPMRSLWSDLRNPFQPNLNLTVGGFKTRPYNWIWAIPVGATLVVALLSFSGMMSAGFSWREVRAAATQGLRLALAKSPRKRAQGGAVYCPVIEGEN